MMGGLVFVLQHEYQREPGVDEVKFIGVYRTRADADAAIHRLVEQPGFRDHPEGFSIDPYELGADHWAEGFREVYRPQEPGGA